MIRSTAIVSRASPCKMRRGTAVCAAFAGRSGPTSVTGRRRITTNTVEGNKRLTSFSTQRQQQQQQQRYCSTTQSKSSIPIRLFTTTSNTDKPKFVMKGPNPDEDGRLYVPLSSPSSSSSSTGTTPSSSSSVVILSPLLSYKQTQIDASSTTLPLPPKLPTPQELAHEIEQHYENEEQFVGGMGETDEGVWFVNHLNSNEDPLMHWELIRDTISLVKESRHGIPFGVYTSGCNLPSDLPSSLLLSESGLSKIQVSLLASDPAEYAKIASSIAGARENDGSAVSSMMKTQFDRVCGFIVQIAEAGCHVQVGVANGRNVNAAMELGRALGAVDAVVYDL